MKTQHTALLVSAALSLAACGESSNPASTDVQQAAPAAQEPAPATKQQIAANDLKAMLANRSEEDRARDAGRKPAEVIEAVGIEAGMNILEVIAGGGWYTEVLALAVGPNGHVTAHNTPGALQFRDGANEKAISARLANDRFPNVTRLNKETHEIVVDDGPFDAAFTALNLHDIYHRGGEVGAVASLAAVYSVLKPGGFFVVIDHEGLAENDNAELHRLVKADAVRVAEAAGFVLDSDSDVLQNDTDDMSMHMRDESVQGMTNRFVLKFRKPE